MRVSEKNEGHCGKRSGFEGRSEMRVSKRVLLVTVMLLLGAYAPSSYAYNLWQWFKARFSPASLPALQSGKERFRVDIVTEGLESPWAITSVPDGRMFILERPGRMRLFKGGQLDSSLIKGVPRVAYEGQGGLLDMALHPQYERNSLVYLAYTVNTEGGIMTRVARFRDTPRGLTEPKVIFPGVLGSDKAKHFGSRLRFGIDGKLYITLGERGEGGRAQDLMDLNGKTLRLNDDGTIPSDNPFVGRADARSEIFSYGHRNSQGMAIQPGTGLIFQTEHGPSWNDAPGGGDEVNIVEAGKNYGWPVIHHLATKEGMISPLLEYTPAVAPAGAMFYTGHAFPSWKGNLFFTTLVGRSLFRIELDGGNVLGQEVLLRDQYGRLRDVAQGPDGLIYVITSDTDAYGPGREGGDRLLRLIPAQ
jgi:glucose/arabinose dehydrogenase